MKVGLYVGKDLGPAGKAVGNPALTTGNGVAQAKAAVALLNARGGLAGHRVIPVLSVYDFTQSQSTQEQAACSTFFEDNKVRAVVAWGISSTLQACAKQHNAPFITSGNFTTNASTLNADPLIVIPSQLVVERFVPLLIQSLAQQGYFKPTSATEQVQVGLIYDDGNDFSGVPALVSAALKRAGQTLKDEFAIPATYDSSKVASASAAGRNAALKFATDSINRVIAVDKTGFALTWFGMAAENQNYYPRYGMSSLDLPGMLRSFMSAKSLTGALGIGWFPAIDVGTRPKPNANMAACTTAMRKAGEDMTIAATRLASLAICDAVLLLGAAWTDPALSPSTFLSGLRALGTTYPPAMALGDDFRSHRDGVSSFRALGYQPQCDCFQYTSTAQPAP